MKNRITNILIINIVFIFSGCNNLHNKILSSTNNYDIRTLNVKHPSAYIPQMCYAKTEDENNITNNSCFVCHTKNIAPNYTFLDEELQKSYNFPEPALKNPFLNSFKDFSKDVSKISDNKITAYINKSNYFDKNKAIILKDRLNKLSKYWDVDGDGKWSGYTPDCYYNFDENGFDVKKDGTYSGWRAFAYMPFFGAFWATNGSTDDVLIRLDSSFQRLKENGAFDKTTYMLNLAIVESLITRKNVSIDRVNEKIFDVDLNKNGIIDYADSIVYKWAPNKGENMYYVGYAKKLLTNKIIHLAAGLFPEGTEFLHSVRYIKSDIRGKIELSPRMKELRYAKKNIWLTYWELKNRGLTTLKEKDLNPDKLETFRGNMEIGLGNNMGWVYQGFIEDKNGNLRPQSYEETLSCMGCHSGIGVTTDSIFSFPRKLDSFTSYQHSWFHWGEHSLKNTPEFKNIKGIYELTNYLNVNHSGDEFSENSEIKKKFFSSNGALKKSEIYKLHKDVTELLYPSHKRAMLLNKSYKVLVEKQIFIDGRFGHTKPFKNIYKKIVFLRILKH